MVEAASRGFFAMCVHGFMLRYSDISSGYYNDDHYVAS
jgi:hypothetical protein